jgi:hypothetical protein
MDQRSGSRSGASRPHSRHPEQPTASCRGRRDQRLRRLRSNRPAVKPRCWSNAVGEQLGSCMVKCCPRRTVRRGKSRPAAALLHATRAYQPFANARNSRWQARLRSKVACATGCRSATVIVNGRHVAATPAPKKQQRRPPPHAPVIGGRSRRRPPMLKEHASPQPMVSQRH